MLLYLYLTGIPLFMFLAWVFSDSLHAGEDVRERSRIPLIITAGVLWPVLLVGVAQLTVIVIQAKVLNAQDQGLNGLTANWITR